MNCFYGNINDYYIKDSIFFNDLDSYIHYKLKKNKLIFIKDKIYSYSNNDFDFFKPKNSIKQIQKLEIDSKNNNNIFYNQKIKVNSLLELLDFIIKKSDINFVIYLKYIKKDLIEENIFKSEKITFVLEKIDELDNNTINKKEELNYINKINIEETLNYLRLIKKINITSEEISTLAKKLLDKELDKPLMLKDIINLTK
ncbi:MAG: hypothetical protein U0457_21600 [Candidatus Sericytochromatia bacterium]